MRGEREDRSTAFAEDQCLTARVAEGLHVPGSDQRSRFVFILFNSLACLCSFPHFHLPSRPSTCLLPSVTLLERKPGS